MIYSSAIIIGCLLFGIFAARSLKKSLLLLICLLPIYLIKVQFFLVPLTLLELFLLILIARWIAQIFFMNASQRVTYISPLKKLPRLYIIGAALLVIGATIGVFVSPELMKALGIWKAYIIEPLIFAVIFFLEMKTQKDLELVGHALVLMGSAAALVGICQIATGIALVAPWDGLTEPARATSFFPYPNALALLLAPIAAYATLYLGYIKSQLRPKSQQQKTNYRFSLKNTFDNTTLFYGSSLTLMLWALVLTKSEGALMGYAIAVILIGLFHRKRIWVIGTGVLAAIAALLMPQTRDAFLAIFQAKDVSTDVRLVLWQGTWRLIKAHPFVGAGLAGFPQLYAQYKEAKHVELLLYPHNIILNFWVETGILGLAGVLALIASAAAQLLTHAKKIATQPVFAGFAAALLALLVHGLVDVPFFKNDLAILWWIIFAGIAALALHSQSLSKTDTR